MDLVAREGFTHVSSVAQDQRIGVIEDDIEIMVVEIRGDKGTARRQCTTSGVSSSARNLRSHSE